jgi:SAM-dependent methyltransferase
VALIRTEEHPRRDDWEKHWTAYSAISARNPAQLYRQKLIFDLLGLAHTEGPVRVLDFGSGSGELAREILRASPDAEVVGLDFSEAGVELAQRKVPRARFVHEDFTKPNAAPSPYERWATHAVCSEVLEHLDDPVAMLKNARSLLGQGARLVVTVPAGPMSAFDKHIGHRRHFSALLLETTLRDAGFDVVEIRGAGFPFFNLYRLAVILRGTALIGDASQADSGRLPRGVRAAIRAFSLLFKLNISKSRLGWQLAALAVAR